MLTSRRSPDQPQTCPFRFTNNILLPPDRKQLFCGFQCVFGPEAALNRLFAHNNARKGGAADRRLPIYSTRFWYNRRRHTPLPSSSLSCVRQITSFFSSRVANSSRTGGARDANSLMEAPLARAPSKSSSNFLAARSFSSCCCLSCSAASAAARCASSFFAS